MPDWPTTSPVASRTQHTNSPKYGTWPRATSRPHFSLRIVSCASAENRDVVALLKPVEQQNADNLAIAYLLGMALIPDGQVEEGQKRVDRILRQGDSAEARLLMGSQMFAAGDFPSAVKQLAGAIELNSSLPGLQGLYGQALLNTGDPDAAADAFRKELASDPNHFEANLYLAQILLARLKWSEADPLVRRAFQLRPDSLEANLGMTDLDVKRRAQAMRFALRCAASPLCYCDGSSVLLKMVRLVNSGTEATMSAIRVARGFTGRDLIVKFEGCYHGHVDSLLVKAGSGVATLGLPDSPGVPKSFSDTTLALPFNSPDAFDERSARMETASLQPLSSRLSGTWAAFRRRRAFSKSCVTSPRCTERC